MTPELWVNLGLALSLAVLPACFDASGGTSSGTSSGTSGGTSAGSASSGTSPGSSSSGGETSTVGTSSGVTSDTSGEPPEETGGNADDTDLEGTLDLGSRTQLFIDDWLIESQSNLDRVLHQAEKTEPIMEPEHPWEGVGTKYSATWFPGTVLRDGDTYKMWYMGMRYTNDGVANYTCYATSPDGINWTKPDLGMFEFQGNTNNNIIGGGSVSVSRDPLAPAEERYKKYSGYDGGHGGWYGADGLNWTKLGFHLDLGDIGTMSFDPVAQEFLIALKGDKKDPQGFNMRKQYNITSKDLITYSDAVRLDTIADDIDAEGYEKAASYGMGIYPYEGIYLGFNWLFLITDRTPGIGEDGWIEVDLLFKRGGFLKQWERPSRDPIIPRGPDGSWDDGMITTADHPLIVDKEMWLYYAGWDGDHVAASRTAKIAIAKWRLDGFMSLDSQDEGTLVTHPMHFTGPNMLVNTNAGGPGASVQVELTDRDDVPLLGYSRDDCESIQTDDVEHVVTWKGKSDLSHLEGRVVKARFYLTNSDLYSVKFGTPRYQ